MSPKDGIKAREEQTAILNELVEALSAVSTEKELLSCARPVPEDASEDVYRVLLLVNRLVLEESEHRDTMIGAMEADLNGGHLVEVARDDFCDPQSGYVAECWPGRWCWNGPTRATVEEAVADGRAHHPGHEPRLAGEPPEDLG